jgi:hypothetical protein
MSSILEIELSAIREQCSLRHKGVDDVLDKVQRTLDNGITAKVNRLEKDIEFLEKEIKVMDNVIKSFIACKEQLMGRVNHLTYLIIGIYLAAGFNIVKDPKILFQLFHP